jgi:hypothetical protein
MILHKAVLALFVTCIVTQVFLDAKPTDISNQKGDSTLLLNSFSGTTTVFLSLRNRPRTEGNFTARDGYFPASNGGYNLCNIFCRNAGRFSGHSDYLRQSAIPNSLQTLFCQFTI